MQINSYIGLIGKTFRGSKGEIVKINRIEDGLVDYTLYHLGDGENGTVSLKKILKMIKDKELILYKNG